MALIEMDFALGSGGGMQYLDGSDSITTSSGTITYNNVKNGAFCFYDNYYGRAGFIVINENIVIKNEPQTTLVNTTYDSTNSILTINGGVNTNNLHVYGYYD